MHASHPVRPPSSRTDGHLGAIGSFLVLALAVAIIKPWGSGAGASIAAETPPPVPSPSPSLPPSTPPQIGFSGLAYDPSIFGNHEPEATWGIWPAGYLVTFGFVIQVSGAPSPSPGPFGPIWPARFVVPEGDHLLLIGINMPHGYLIGSARLGRYPAAGGLVDVGIERLRAPWPDHFAVIGIPTAAGDSRLDVWPPGRYRLDLTFEPGGISRSIELLVADPLGGL